MKIKNTMLFLVAVIALMLAACSTEQAVTDKNEAPSQEESVDKIDFNHTYWTAVRYESYSDDAKSTMLPVKTENLDTDWWIDILLYEDGTMKLRDVSGCVYSGMAMEGEWTQAEDGNLVCTSGHYIKPMNGEVNVMEDDEIPVFSVLSTDEPCMIVLEYYDGCVYFEQAEMPEMKLCVADLQGSWNITANNTENAKNLPAVVFDAKGNDMVYSQTDVQMGTDSVKCFNSIMEYCENELFAGCANSEWFVKIKANDDDKEYCATLTDEDTLILGDDSTGFATYNRQ